MFEVPATATSAAVTDAVSLAALMKEIVLSLLSHCMVELETKLSPFTVKVNPVPQVLAEEGERELTEGTGLGGGGGLEDPPPHPQAVITNAKVKAIEGIKGAACRRFQDLGLGRPPRKTTSALFTLLPHGIDSTELRSLSVRTG